MDLTPRTPPSLLDPPLRPAEFQPDLNPCYTVNIIPNRNQRVHFTQYFHINVDLAASTFNRLDHYISSLDHRTCSYVELAASSLVVTETIASTHCAYPRTDGQAELAWVLVAYRGSLHVRRRSPIPVLNWPDVA